MCKGRILVFMFKFLKNSTAKLFIALILGAAFGGIMKILPPWSYVDDIMVNAVLKLLGNGFIELIKMTVVPLIFTSIVCGIASFGDTKKLGKIGIKTIIMFLVTTVIAVIIAIAMAEIFKPGFGINATLSQAGIETVNKGENKGLIDIILEMIPSNPIKSMSKGNLLQILIFASFFGVSLGMMEDKAKQVVDFMNVVNDSIMKIVSFIMKLAPIGVFSLIAITTYSVGYESFIGIIKLIFVIIIALIIQAFIVYGSLYSVFTRKSFLEFLKNYVGVAGIAFSTSSSNAALPVSMKMMENMKVNKSIYQFVLPVGSTVNMAGTAIMQGISAIFIAQAYNISLSLSDMITITLTTVFASVGAAGVPGGGMIMMARVIESVGLPVEGLGLIIGFDRILDMVRTVVNVMGDCVCAVVVDKSEK